MLNGVLFGGFWFFCGGIGGNRSFKYMVKYILFCGSVSFCSNRSRAWGLVFPCVVFHRYLFVVFPRLIMFYICLCICFLCLFCVSCVGCVLLCLGMVFSRFLPAESIIGGGWASSYWTLTYKKEVSRLFFKPGLNCF